MRDPNLNSRRRSVNRLALAALTFLLVVVAAAGLAAQQQTSQDRKVALVIGNGAYRTSTVSPLTNPPNDARDVSRELEGIGFDVTTVTDGTEEAMGIAIEAFGAELQRADVGLFYYAGHGVQYEGSNYLIPVDADLPNTNLLRYRAIAADEILAYMEGAGTNLNLFFLDACRDNPLPQVSRSMNRGLAAASMRPPETMIVYATAAGAVADDGRGRNSPFTEAFLEHIDTPGLDVYDLYREISSDVSTSTGGEQRPEQYGNVTVRYALVPEDGTGGGGGRAPSLAALTTYGSVRISAATAGTIYLDGDRLGSVSAGSSAVINDVETGSRSIEIRYGDGEQESSPVTVREGETARASFSYVERRAADEQLRNEIFIEGGSFRMGSTDGGDDEDPVHTVRVGDFRMMETEVTHAAFIEFLNSAGVSRDGSLGGNELIDMDDSDCAVDYSDYSGRFSFGGSGYASSADTPVMEVTWYGAVVYANWLSEEDGLTPAYRISGSTVSWNRSADGWRLPTEAEWEYAARGGQEARNTTYAGSNSVDRVAWYDDNSGDRTQPVGQKQPNELGLHDMSGNVWEWCWDWYDGDYYGSAPTSDPSGPGSGSNRVRRGGSWGSYASGTRVAFRSSGYPGNSYDSSGFRLVRD